MSTLVLYSMPFFTIKQMCPNNSHLCALKVVLAGISLSIKGGTKLVKITSKLAQIIIIFHIFIMLNTIFFYRLDRPPPTKNMKITFQLYFHNFMFTGFQNFQNILSSKVLNHQLQISKETFQNSMETFENSGY